MARRPLNKRQRKLLLLQPVTSAMMVLLFGFYYFLVCLHLRFNIREIKTKEDKRMARMKWMFRLTMECDAICISELRMDRATFNI